MRCQVRLFTAVLLVASAAAIVRAQVAYGSTPSSQITTATQLEPGKPVERELTAGQTHTYTIASTGRQYLHLVVEQKGIDVTLALFAPDAKQVNKVNSPEARYGMERLAAIIDSVGGYKLQVSAPEKEAPAGKYEVRLVELRPVAMRDEERVAAEQSFRSGEQLALGNTKETNSRAIEMYQKALASYQSLGDRYGEARVLHNIAAVYESQGDFKKAVDWYNQAVTVWRAVGNGQGEGTSLLQLGWDYINLGDFSKSLECTNQALLLLRAAGDRQGEAGTLNDIGTVFDDEGDYKKALDYRSQALPLSRSIGDRRTEGYILIGLGNSNFHLREYSKALDYYNQAIQLKRELGEKAPYELSRVAAIYIEIGDVTKALDYYNQALTIMRSSGDRNGEAQLLMGIGVAYATLGQPAKALDYYNQALPTLSELGNRQWQGGTLFNMGAAYTELGDYQQALDSYNHALKISQEIKELQAEGVALRRMGNVYQLLGLPSKALDYYNQALAILRTVNDRLWLGGTLNDLGRLYGAAGDQQKAIDFYKQALALSRSLGNPTFESDTLSNIGRTYKEAANYQEALRYYNQSLALLRTTGDRWREANLLSEAGDVYLAMGDERSALENYNRALSETRATGNHAGEALALYELAHVYRENGRLSDSLANIEAALTVVESLRTKIASQELRSSYFATVQKYYELYIDLLMRLRKQKPSEGYDGKALQANERARARSLLEILAEAHADIRQGVDSQLLERERTARRELNAKAQQQIKLLSGKHTDEEASAVARELESLTSDFQLIETEIRRTSPRYAALTQPQPLNLKEIEQQLDSDTLLLEYSLGEERSYLWSVTPTSINSYELPKRDDIESLARQVYALLTNSRQWQRTRAGQRQLTTGQTETTTSVEPAMRLSQMLLAPVVAQLGKKRLVIVTDGALQYIPFTALPAPVAVGPSAQMNNGKSPPAKYHPLVMEHEIVSLPSASTLAVLRQEVKGRKPAAKTVAALADPVFQSTDERLKTTPKTSASPVDNSTSSATRALPVERAAAESGMTNTELQIPRLPGTRAEAEHILALVPGAQSKAAFDFAASRQTATSPELSQYRYVHFATHGFLDSVHPELSGIVLSMIDEKGNPQDGFLRAHEVFNLKLPAELVVLSACQTGLGKEVRGEGLVGLTRGFMYAGAPRVVVSLWSVNDQATAELMGLFYRGMLNRKLTPAAALRAAQVSLMKEPGWESPFYWAAFTIQGEWR